jgi:peptidoglycan/LPS O-acetylase OafA/YrhL
MAGNLIVGEPGSSNISAKLPHVLGLDTVRAFAALSVVLAHILGPTLPDMLVTLGLSKDLAELAKYIFTGHPAVIVFFVVSGFCIHYPYTRRELPVIAFTVARWTRIMIPALVAMLFAKLLHVRGFNFTEGFILWSIVCELWYYSLYPFFFLLSRKVSFEVQFVAIFMVSLALVAHLGSDQYGNAHIYGPWLNWLIALPSWLLGCVLASRLSSEAIPKQCSRRGIILWRVSVAMVASVLYWLTLNTPFGYYLTMNIFAILVSFWIYAEINAQKEGNSLFERTGKWSYSIYLFHMVFVTFIGKIIGVALIKIPVILWLSYQAYKFVEKPSHEYARQLFQKSRERFQHLTVAHR